VDEVTQEADATVSEYLLESGKVAIDARGRSVGFTTRTLCSSVWCAAAFEFDEGQGLLCG
jgi:hypothetical protein